MTPELIQALTPITLAIVGAITAWQGKRLKELSEKFASLEGKFRSSIRHIRDWHRWDASGRVGLPPAIPDDLRDEV